MPASQRAASIAIPLLDQLQIRRSLSPSNDIFLCDDVSLYHLLKKCIAGAGKQQCTKRHSAMLEGYLQQGEIQQHSAGACEFL